MNAKAISRGLRARIDRDIAACKEGCISTREAAKKFSVPEHIIRVWFHKGHLAGHLQGPSEKQLKLRAERRARQRENAAKQYGDGISPPSWWGHNSEKPHGILHISAAAIPVTIVCPRCKGSGKTFVSQPRPQRRW